MGAWGHGIRQDDVVCDVIGEFEELLKAGKSAADATDAVKSRFRSLVGEPSFWIALAEMQWTYNALDPSVLQRVRDDLTSGRSLEQWEADARGLTKRRAVLEKFLRKLDVPKATPTRRPTAIVRAPKFLPGDCLSIHRFSGDFGAAIVLASDHSSPEHGRNLVGVLDYCSDTSPTMEVFLERRWALLTQDGASDRLHVGWFYPEGFRKVKDRIAVIGTVEVLPSDPKDSAFYFRWENIGERLR